MKKSHFFLFGKSLGKFDTIKKLKKTCFSTFSPISPKLEIEWGVNIGFQ